MSLLEELPRTEWTCSAFNERAVASRIAALQGLRGRGTIRTRDRNPARLRRGSRSRLSLPLASMKSTAWSDVSMSDDFEQSAPPISSRPTPRGECMSHLLSRYGSMFALAVACTLCALATLKHSNRCHSSLQMPNRQRHGKASGSTGDGAS